MSEASDKAKEIVCNHYSGCPFSALDGNAKTLVDEIQKVIEEAKAEEREACVRCVDVCSCEITLDEDGLNHILWECIQRIRARGGKE